MMGLEKLQERALKIWQTTDRRCVICKNVIAGFDEESVYRHLLEHRVRFLEKVIHLYCDCDCDKPPKPGEDHWMFCRRRIGDDALEATLEQMIVNGRQ